MKKITLFLTVFFIFLSISSTVFGMCMLYDDHEAGEEDKKISDCFLDCIKKKYPVMDPNTVITLFSEDKKFRDDNLKQLTECENKCKNVDHVSDKFQQKTKSLNNYKTKTIYTKVDDVTMNISHWIFNNNTVYIADNLFLTQTFVDKFSTPYVAVKLPNGSTIDKSSLNVKLSYLEAKAGLNKDTISEKLKANEWDWLVKNSERKEFIFTLDSSQDERILSVLNILHPAGKGRHWEILNFVMPDGFEFPKSNYFFNQMISFEYDLKIQTIPTEIEYLISSGKLEIGPIVITIYNTLDKTASKPALEFKGRSGTSKARIELIKYDFQISEVNWLCNCDNKDYRVTLNASLPNWKIDNFSFYYASGDPGEEDFQIGNKIGNNGVQITIPKKTKEGQAGVDFPWGMDSCQCVQLATIANSSPDNSKKIPGILNIIAQDTSDANVKAKANIAFLSGNTAIYPLLNVKNDGTNLTLSWYDPFATSYTLFYLPMDLSKVGQVALGKLENATVPSSNIPPLYIAIYACHADGTCDFSNIEKTQ